MEHGYDWVGCGVVGWLGIELEGFFFVQFSHMLTVSLGGKFT